MLSFLFFGGFRSLTWKLAPFNGHAIRGQMLGEELRLRGLA
jgi:hypothetical protein